MQKQLGRTRHRLQQQADQHVLMKMEIDALLREYDRALDVSLREQIDFVHRAQRLIKICVSRTYDDQKLHHKVLTAKDPSWTAMPSLAVEDELKKSLAKQLFESSRARSGEKIIIATTSEGREVTEELVQLCLDNNVDFELGIKDPERMMHMINHLDNLGLQALTDLNLKKYEGVNIEVVISSSLDPEIKKKINQNKLKVYKQMNHEIHDRAMSGDLHYTLTKIPTASDAALDGMNFVNYLNLFFELCDQPWKQIQIAQQKLIEFFNRASLIHLTNSDGTDLKLDITGQTFANSVIAKNIPGSEIFSAPLRTGVNGTLVAKGKFRYGTSGIIEDITLWFEKGRIKDFGARSGEKDLNKIITADDQHGEGARYLGELGIGTNPHLRQHLINSLLVEKIGGSFHVALGSCYFYDEYLGTPVRLKNGNVSFSSTHWDLTAMLRGKKGKLFLDKQLIQDDGNWLGDDFAVLNEGWGAIGPDLQPEWWREKYAERYSKKS